MTTPRRLAPASLIAVVFAVAGCVTVSPAVPTQDASSGLDDTPGVVASPSPTPALIQTPAQASSPPQTSSPSPDATATGRPTASAPPLASLPAGTATPSIPASPASPSAVPSLTDGASTSPSAQASGSLVPGTGFEADMPIFEDDFSRPSTDWGRGELDQGSLDYQDGTFVIEFAQAQASLWSRRSFGAAWDVVRVSGSLDIGSQADTAEGAAGLMCGNEAGDHVGGLVNSAGEWVFFTIEDAATSPLGRGLLPTTDSDGRYDLGLECAGTDTGALRLRLTVGGQEVAVFERVDAGLPTFERAGMYAESADVGFIAIFDDVEVTGGTVFGGFPGASPQAVSPYEELLYDLPSAFIEDCQPAPPEDPLILAQAICIPATEAAEARFMLFAGLAERDAFFQSFAAEHDPSPTTGSCREGPFSGSFTAPSTNGQDGAYRFACFAVPTSAGDQTHIMWTDPHVAMIGLGVLDRPDFAALYDWWLTIGPAG
ncbi:MAG: hypothetical protein ACR2LP_03735 [Candidatus Limnocylindrales bacterium]